MNHNTPAPAAGTSAKGLTTGRVGLLGAVMAHIPVLNLFAPALSGLAFVHYLLSALRVSRLTDDNRENIIEVK